MPPEDAIIHICFVVFFTVAETGRKMERIKRKSQRKYQINFSHFIKLELKIPG